MRHMCINCGSYIIKSSRMDQFVCSRCEEALEVDREEKYILEMM